MRHEDSARSGDVALPSNDTRDLRDGAGWAYLFLVLVIAVCGGIIWAAFDWAARS